MLSFGLAGWMLGAGLVAVAGLCLGLAVLLPRSLHYRVGPPLLIGLVPVLMLAHFLYAWTVAAPRDIQFLNLVFFFHARGPQFVLAAMVGVAIAAGFAPRRRD